MIASGRRRLEHGRTPQIGGFRGTQATAHASTATGTRPNAFCESVDQTALHLLLATLILTLALQSRQRESSKSLPSLPILRNPSDRKANPRPRPCGRRAPSVIAAVHHCCEREEDRSNTQRRRRPDGAESCAARCVTRDLLPANAPCATGPTLLYSRLGRSSTVQDGQDSTRRSFLC